MSENTKFETWEETVFKALTRLGADSSHHLSAIYAESARVRQEAGAPLSSTWTDTIRRVVQQSPRIRPGGLKGFWEIGQPDKS